MKNSQPQAATMAERLAWWGNHQHRDHRLPFIPPVPASREEIRARQAVVALQLQLRAALADAGCDLPDGPSSLGSAIRNLEQVIHTALVKPTHTAESLLARAMNPSRELPNLMRQFHEAERIADELLARAMRTN